MTRAYDRVAGLLVETETAYCDGDFEACEFFLAKAIETHGEEWRYLEASEYAAVHNTIMAFIRLTTPDLPEEQVIH